MRHFLFVAAAVVLCTVALHQVMPTLALPDPATLRPFAIGPYDHVKPLEFFGLLGPWAVIGLVAALLTAMALFAVTGTPGARLTRLEWIGFGLVAGGMASNAGEVLIRGAAMDWLWFSPDGRTAIIANSADGALLSGALLIALRAARESLSLLRTFR